MRALVLDKHPYLDRDYPDPKIESGKKLIQVKKAGICNTDLELLRGYKGNEGALVLGHEFVGITGEGQRVVGEINISCGKCEFCQRGIPTHCLKRTVLGIMQYDGAFADKIVLPVENIHPLPDSIRDEQAVFIEPLAAALQTLHQTHISPHHRVILLGAGKLGLLVAQVIALTGCDLTVVCRHDKQTELLKKWGIDSARSDEIEEHSADIVVDCTGNETGFADALNLVKARGTIHLKSTYAQLPQANLSSVVVDEIRIETSRCGSFPAAIRLLERGLIDVESMIDAHYSLDDAIEALDFAAKKGVLKVILEIS